MPRQGRPAEWGFGGKKDTLLQTISGSMFLDSERKHQDAFSQTIKSPDGA